MSDNTLDKIAIYFALEHDFDADLARRYCTLLCDITRTFYEDTTEYVDIWEGRRDTVP